MKAAPGSPTSLSAQKAAGKVLREWACASETLELLSQGVCDIIDITDDPQVARARSEFSPLLFELERLVGPSDVDAREAYDKARVVAVSCGDERSRPQCSVTTVDGLLIGGFKDEETRKGGDLVDIIHEIVHVTGHYAPHGQRVELRTLRGLSPEMTRGQQVTLGSQVIAVEGGWFFELVILGLDVPQGNLGPFCVHAKRAPRRWKASPGCPSRCIRRPSQSCEPARGRYFPNILQRARPTWHGSGHCWGQGIIVCFPREATANHISLGARVETWH